jgi:hypothetical protein
LFRFQSKQEPENRHPRQVSPPLETNLIFNVVRNARRRKFFGVVAASPLIDQHYEDYDYGFRENGYYVYCSGSVADLGNKGLADLSISVLYCSSACLDKQLGF